MELSQPVIASILSLCGIAAGVLGTWLAFRGKRADQKLLERQQSHTELAELADTRLEEITRKDERIAGLEASNSGLQSRYDTLWGQHRRLIDLYYRWRRDGAPAPERMPSDN